MPTNRRYRARTRREVIDPDLWAILTDEQLSDDEDRFVLLDRGGYNELLPYWLEYHRVILAEWIKTKPGTRPAMWWRYDAPRLDPERLGRWSRTVLAPRLIQTRRKLRGDGKPLHEALNFAPSHHYGIPAWFGNPDNPPVFESQHAYLKRHDLLLSTECHKITEPFPHPLRVERAVQWSR